MPKTTEFHAAMARALGAISPRVITLDSTASTNDDARALGREGAPHLSVVVADEQTAGRGRLGRVWVGPPATTLQSSWVVRPPFPVERWTVVPLLAGVAAAEAIRARTGVDATLKWPNDVRAGERKLGGILTEAEVPRFVIVGLGINVSHTSFPPELADIATSVALEGGMRLDRADLLAATLARFERCLQDVPAALDRYRALCVTLGREVRIERDGEPVTGIARDVDDRGALLLEAADGLVRLAAGDVVHVR